MEANRKEIYRYLGFGRAEPDERTVGLVEEVLAELEKKVTPRNVHKELSCEQNGEKIILGGENGFNITSSKLAINLAGCEKAIIFCATLGREPDLLQKRSMLTSSARAAAVQAAGAALIEAYCNKINRDFEEQYRGKYFLRPRFSPGYGDFALEHQRDFFRLLDIERRLGVELSEQLLMIPTKTVTAVIGLTNEQGDCNISKCAACEKTDCAFRLE